MYTYYYTRTYTLPETLILNKCDLRNRRDLYDIINTVKFNINKNLFGIRFSHKFHIY